MTDRRNPDFLIGSLVGQMTSLLTTIQTMQLSFNRLEDAFAKSIADLQKRDAENEKAVTSLQVKMSLLGVVAGGVGSVIMSFIYPLFQK